MSSDDIRDFQVGVPSLLLPFSHDLADWKQSRPTHGIGKWTFPIRRAFSEVLNSKRDLAFLFRDLATLRTDLPLFATVDDLLWKGPTTAFPPIADRLDKASFSKERVPRSC